MPKANPLGDLTYEIISGGEGDSNDMASSTHIAQTSVHGGVIPAPPITSRTEEEARIGSYGGVPAVSGVHDATSNP